MTVAHRVAPTLAALCAFACGGSPPESAAPPAASPAPFAMPVAVADRFSCGVRDGTTFCWGRHPRAGRDPGIAQYSDLGPHVLALGAGDSMLCALREDGTVRCNRRRFYMGAEPATVEFADVPGLEARRLAVGDAHACALGKDGSVACWGSNASGQLADPELGARGTPVRVPLDAASAVDARGATTCAVVEGRIVCWGPTFSGDAVQAPTTVPDIEGAIDVRVGRRHACGLLQGGAVACWGAAESEALDAPAGPFESLAAGNDVSCGLLPSGDVVCWGAEAPAADLVASFAGAAALAFGERHGCLSRDGAPHCWGQNDRGQVLGSLSSDRPPGRVLDLADAVDVQTHAGGRCALRRNGRVVCWGRLDPLPWDDSVEPAEGPRWRTTRVPVERAGVEGATALAMGYEHGCALVAGGELRCWGSNEVGQLGIPGASILREARTVPAIIGARSVCATDMGTCVVTAEGGVSCVGAVGEGDWSTDQWLTLRGVGDTAELACGSDFACARSTSGRVLCWGDDFRTDRQGYRARPAPPRPPRARTFATGAAQLYVGTAHACLRREDKSLECFGYGTRGQLGVATCGGEGPCRVTHRPVRFPGAETADAVFLAHQTCLLRGDEELSCVGNEDVDVGGVPREPEPRSLPGTGGVVGYTPGCVLHEDGHVTCWGANREGEAGSGIPVDFTRATLVPFPA